MTDLTNKMSEYSHVASMLDRTIIALDEARDNANASIKAVKKCMEVLASNDTDELKTSNIVALEDAMHYSIAELIAVIETLSDNYFMDGVPNLVPDFSQTIVCDVLEAKADIEIPREIMAMPVKELLVVTIKSYMDEYFDGKRDTKEFINPGMWTGVPFTDYLIDGIYTIGDLAYWIYYDTELIQSNIAEDKNDEDGYITAFKTICGSLDIICRTHWFTKRIFDN